MPKNLYAVVPCKDHVLDGTGGWPGHWHHLVGGQHEQARAQGDDGDTGEPSHQEQEGEVDHAGRGNLPHIQP